MLGMNTRYVEGYSNERQIPASAINLGYTNYVKSFLVYDFSIKKTIQLSLGEMEIGLGIINAFDKKHPCYTTLLTLVLIRRCMIQEVVLSI